MRKQRRHKQSWFGRLLINFVMSAGVLAALSLGIACLCAQGCRHIRKPSTAACSWKNFLPVNLLLTVFLKTVSAIYVVSFGSTCQAELDDRQARSR